MKPIHAQDVDHALNAAEQRFDKCWSYLVAIKRGQFSEDNIAPFTEFQPLLATALFELSLLHGKISIERQDRIGRKSDFSSTWFSGRMAFLDRQQQRLISAIHIGRSIGDAFAWFFYQSEREFLRQHMQEPKLDVMSTGTGGIGELETARYVPMLGEYLVLHHCTTGMLRLGDITLINLDGMRVAGIGELKSHSDQPGRVVVSMSVLGDGPKVKLAHSNDLDTPPSELPDVMDRLTAKARERLQRQMKRIQDTHEVARKEPDAKHSLEMEDNMSSLAKLLRSASSERLSTARVGRSLLMFSYGLRPAPLAKRLSGPSKTSGSKKFLRQIDSLLSRVTEIMVPERGDNSAIIGSFYYNEEGAFNYLPGMTHPFWWPIDTRLLKPLIFKSLIVGSIFNPSWLFKTLEESGFDVDTTDVRRPKITRLEGDALFRAEGVWFYFRAIHDYLMGEDAIAHILKLVSESNRIDSSYDQKRVDIRLYQEFGRPTEKE